MICWLQHPTVWRVRLVVSALLLSFLLSAGAEAAALPAKSRMKVFEQVWRLIRDRYYDPSFNGLDWNGIHERYRPRVQSATSDDELYAVLKQMTGELHDAHTRFRTPQERERASHRVATSTGVLIGDVEGVPTVVNVEPDSEASESGVEPGMVLASVDGEPAAQRLAEIQQEVGSSSSQRATALLDYFRLLAGEPGSLVRLGLLRPDGSQLNVVLKRHVVALGQAVTVNELPSGVIDLRVRFIEGSVAKAVRQELKKHPNAPGVILDLRGNPGGNFRGVLDIGNDFFLQRVSLGRVVTRSGKTPSLVLRLFGVPGQLEVGGSGRQIYSGPVVILINEGSGSAAELLAAGMQDNGRASIVGRQSCGCVLGSVAHKVIGGGEVDISEFGILTAKGKRLEGTGVVPDVSVPLKLADLRSHRDASLEEAARVLQSADAMKR